LNSFGKKSPRKPNVVEDSPMLKPVLTITMAARRLGVSTRTIRTYEAEGFIALERSGGRCFLRPEDVEIVALIERLKNDLGINMAGVGVVLEMRRKMIELQEQLTRWEAEFEKQVERAIEEQRREMERSLSRLGLRSLVVQKERK